MPTKIEWTDETWNPVTGCDRCSPGCAGCYALTLAARLKRMGSAHYQLDGNPSTSGPGFAVTLHPDTLGVPLRWVKPRRVFVNSMSDLFHPDIPAEFIADVFAVMAVASAHTFQILTKRPRRMVALLNDDGFRDRVDRAMTGPVTGFAHVETFDRGWPLPNVWLGVTIESDAYAWRANALRDTPAAVRFVSAEPLLSGLPSLDLAGVDWLIVGGETGTRARPMHPEWVADLCDRSARPRRCPTCGASDPSAVCSSRWHVDLDWSPTAFFLKQWGEWGPVDDGDRTPGAGGTYLDLDGALHEVGLDTLDRTRPPDTWRRVARLGRGRSGRLFAGREWNGYPT